MALLVIRPDGVDKSRFSWRGLLFPTMISQSHVSGKDSFFVAIGLFASDVFVYTCYASCFVSPFDETTREGVVVCSRWGLAFLSEGHTSPTDMIPHFAGSSFFDGHVLLQACFYS